MTRRIEADDENLMKQAPMTASLYLSEARRSIDEAFGAGHAQKNPDLVIGFIRACTMDFMTAQIRIASENISDAIKGEDE
jgi:hypothetical protein